MNQGLIDPERFLKGVLDYKDSKDLLYRLMSSEYKGKECIKGSFGSDDSPKFLNEYVIPVLKKLSDENLIVGK